MSPQHILIPEAKPLKQNPSNDKRWNHTRR